MNPKRVVEAMKWADTIWTGRDDYGEGSKPFPVCLAEAVRELAWAMQEEDDIESDRFNAAYDLAAWITEPQPVAVCDDCGDLYEEDYDSGHMRCRQCGKPAAEVDE